MTLSELVINYRAEHGLSQRQFANICSLSNGFISMLEKNMNPKTGQPLVPNILNLQKLAAGMNLSLGQLFDMVEDMPVDLGEIDNKIKSATDPDDGLTSEIIRLFASLPSDRKREAINYLRYLSGKKENP